jgi:XTP/dITP diphosphohydrolase
MDILIGTKNQYKIGEMISFLYGLNNIKIHDLDEIPEKIVVEEDQSSFKENAIKKAIEISKHTNWYVFTSDGGVDIPGLGGKWNILKNQRIVGESNSDKEKVDKLISMMSGLKGEDRKCTYHLALAIAKDGNILWSTKDIIDKGYIVEKPENTEIPPYKWMNHVWYYPQFNKTANQVNSTEREEIRKMAEYSKKSLQLFLKTIK